MNKFVFLKKGLYYINKANNELDIIKEKTRVCKFLIFIDLIWCYIRYGILLRQYIKGEFYLRKSWERKNIVTFLWHRKMRLSVNNPDYEHFFEVKSDFNDFFSDYIGRDWLLLDTSSKCASFEEFLNFIKTHTSFLVKPLTEQQGHGIYKVDKVNDVNQMYHMLIQKNVLVEEIISQHKGMIFGNASVNTIRVYTVINSRGKANILKCILRAGVGNSVVDNYAAGGSIYQVDNDYGIVVTKGFSKYKDDNLFHPGTDIVMLGYKVPNWDCVKMMVMNAAEKIPEVRYVGWDVAITEQGCLLIEGNHDPDYELLEFVGDREYIPKIQSFLK